MKTIKKVTRQMDNVALKNAEITYINPYTLGIKFPQPEFGEVSESRIEIHSPTTKRVHTFSGEITFNKVDGNWIPAVSNLCKVDTEKGTIQPASKSNHDTILKKVTEMIDEKGNLNIQEIIQEEITPEFLEQERKAYNKKKVENLETEIQEMKKVVEEKDSRIEELNQEKESLIQRISEKESEVENLVSEPVQEVA